MVSYCHIPDTHQEPVSRLMFEPTSGIVMSSSECDTTSVVCTNVTLKREPYIWKIKQVNDFGVNVQHPLSTCP